MEISKDLFGTMPDGEKVFCWTLINENGLAAKIIDYGATVQSIIVPDKNGKPVDVVLGYDTLEGYISGDCYIGATVGRFANRIKNGCFELNGEKYELCRSVHAEQNAIISASRRDLLDSTLYLVGKDAKTNIFFCVLDSNNTKNGCRRC